MKHCTTTINCTLIIPQGGTKDLGSRLTAPVIAVTFVFFFAYPFLAIEDSLCYQLNCNYKLIIVFNLISEIAKVLNSTANFLFYCFFGRRFRRTFFYMTVSWRRRLSRVVTSKSGDFRYSTTAGAIGAGAGVGLGGGGGGGGGSGLVGDGHTVFKLENRTSSNHSPVNGYR